MFQTKFSARKDANKWKRGRGWPLLKTAVDDWNWNYDSPDFAGDGRVSRRRLRRHLEVRVRLVQERLPPGRKVLEHEAGTRTLQRVATGAGAIFDVEAEMKENFVNIHSNNIIKNYLNESEYKTWLKMYHTQLTLQLKNHVVSILVLMSVVFLRPIHLVLQLISLKNKCSNKTISGTLLLDILAGEASFTSSRLSSQQFVYIFQFYTSVWVLRAQERILF